MENVRVRTTMIVLLCLQHAIGDFYHRVKDFAFWPDWSNIETTPVYLHRVHCFENKRSSEQGLVEKGKSFCISTRHFGMFELKMVAGSLLVCILLHTISMNLWSSCTASLRSELLMNRASNEANRELVGSLTIDTYQGTEAPIGQSAVPTPSLVSLPLSSTSPSNLPSTGPSSQPTTSSAPSRTFTPSKSPSQQPSPQPTISHPPSPEPSVFPSGGPTVIPSEIPSAAPSLSAQPSTSPSSLPSYGPSVSVAPSVSPSISHEPSISASPTDYDPARTNEPSAVPTETLSMAPSPYPSKSPSEQPSSMPSLQSDLYAEHFMTIVLEGVLEDFRASRWQVETSEFVQEFWNDRDVNKFSPVFVGHVNTRYIRETRIGTVSPGADNTSLPLAIEYHQSINYTMIVYDYDTEMWGDLEDTLFTYPFKLNPLGYMSIMMSISNNPSTIFLSSYKITTPNVDELGSSGTDAAIISILVIVVALVLMVAAYYVVHLLRKDRDAQKELLIKAEQGGAAEVENGQDRLASQETLESPAGSRYQSSVAPVPISQPGHMRINSANTSSDRDENSNNQHRRHLSNSNVDDRSNYMSDLEGMVIDSHSVGDDGEDNHAGPTITNPIHGGYPEDHYCSPDEDSDDDYEDPLHMRQSAFILKIEDIED